MIPKLSAVSAKSRTVSVTEFYCYIIEAPLANSVDEEQTVLFGDLCPNYLRKDFSRKD